MITWMLILSLVFVTVCFCSAVTKLGKKDKENTRLKTRMEVREKMHKADIKYYKDKLKRIRKLSKC